MNQLFDPIRNKELSALPEEIVRQDLLDLMIHKLGYPKSLISVEKDLSQLPHLKGKKHELPFRRADIICFAKNIHPSFYLYPLLMIECKADKLTKKTIEQVVGYNHFVNSYFISIANYSEIKTLWYNEKEKKYDSINFLPSYNQLLFAAKGL